MNSANHFWTVEETAKIELDIMISTPLIILFATEHI